MADKRPALGRGLSALIPDATGPALDDRSLDVDSDLLRPNKFQPRTTMDDSRLEDLTKSIRTNWASGFSEKYPSPYSST